MSATAKTRPVRRASSGNGAPVRETAPAMAQSAAAPSPFTPIANYGFPSDCHTGALIAPDGAIDWMCVPGFDSPDTSLFPGIGAVNPALTAMANGLRVGDHLLERMGAERPAVHHAVA